MTNSCGQIQVQLLEHLYGLLAEEDGRALIDHVGQCSGCQAELNRAQEQMAFIADAAKEQFPNVRFMPPAADDPLVDIPSTRGRIGLSGIRWAVAAGILLAVTTVGVFGGIYWRQQTQVAQAESILRRAKDEVAQAEILRLWIIDESQQNKADFRKQVAQADKEAQRAQDALVQLGREHQQKIKQTRTDVNAKQMDLTVIGPRAIEPGAANPFQVLTKSFRQEPMPARISVTVRDREKREIFKEANVLSQGNLMVMLPRDLPLKADSALTLHVEARAEKGQPVILSEAIPLAGPVYVTHLVTDKPIYQPGEVVRFRSLTLERFSLRPPSEELELIYTLTTPAGAKTQILRGASQVQRESKLVLGPGQLPIQGVGPGEIQIDKEALSGEYTLTVSEGRQRFPPQDRKFWVLRPGEPGDKNEPMPRQGPADSQKLTVEFFPEGGDLVAGVPNRVYFQARTSLDKPAEMKGRIVDEAGKEITRVALFHDSTHPEANQGTGVFEFSPQLGKTYQLKTDTPAGMAGQHFLPPVKAEGVVMTIPHGVTTDKEPIRVTIRSVGADRSLLVGAYCRGRLMGHQTVDVKKDDVKEVELVPEKGVGGVYRVTVFERVREQARSERLVPRAERLIYRASATQLHLAIRPDKTSYAHGDPVHVGISATNEKGHPQPAIVMMAVVDQSLLKLAGEKTYRSMPAHFLLTTELRRPEDLEHADFFLRADGQAAKALDLLLGTQGWRRFAEQDPDKFQKEQKEDARRLLAIEGQSPLRSVNFGQEEVQKVVKEFQGRYAELDKKLTVAEDKMALVRKGDVHQERLKELREKAAREDTERIAAVDYAKDAQESLAIVAGKFQNHREFLRDVLLPILLGVFLLTTIGSLVLALVRRRQGRAIPYLAGAAGSLALVALTLNQRASFLHDVTPENGINLTHLGAIDESLVTLGPEDGIANPRAIQKEHGGKPPPPVIAPLKPNLPRSQDKKNSNENKGQQGTAKNQQREMPMIPLHPVPPKEDQPQVASPQQPAPRDRMHLLPQMPVPTPPSSPLVVREYAHLHASRDASPDFAQTLYWHPVLVLPDGNADVTFDLCDSVSSYQILVAGHTLDGRIAEATAEVAVHKGQAVHDKQDREK